MPDEPFKGFRITSDPDETSIEQPQRTPAREVPELPLRLLLVSDLAPQERVEDWSAARLLHQVDKNNFRTLMQTLAPRLTFEVPNTLSETPKLLEVNLRFPDLDAFQPAQVAGQVPALAQLAQVRALVEQVQRSVIDLDAFRTELTAKGIDAGWAQQLYQTLSAPEKRAAPATPPPPSAPPPASSDEDGSLGRLLGLVDLGDTDAAPKPPAPSGGGLMGALLGAVTGEADAAPRVEKTAVGQLLADLDDTISTQLNAIIGHEAFRSLEAAWRGLKFLVDRIDFRKDIHLEVLAAGKDDLSAAFYYQILMPEHSSDQEKPPLSLIALDAAFDNSSADLALLEDLATTGASLQTPILASATPTFFGVENYEGLSSLPPLWQLVEKPEYIAWNKLREEPAARYLALALPSFLLREPYSATHPTDAFPFDEAEGLWGNASLAVVAAVASSVADTGWPTHLLGSTRSINHLPLWKSSRGHTPLAVLIPDAKLGDYSKGGFVVLGGMMNHDALYLARAVTVCRPETYEDLMAAAEARIHVTLACTLFVARAAHHILTIQNAIVPGTPLEQVREEVQARLRAFFHTEGQIVPPDAVQVEVADASGVPDQNLLAIRLNTPRHVLDRPVSLVLGLPVPK